jgi:hypothetical protein
MPNHPSDNSAREKSKSASPRRPPDLYQIVIQCRDEAQQRELFERLQREGLKVRLLVL